MTPRPDSVCIVVSGLPGSGKTTLGKAVAVEFDLPFFDKDDYLEQLYEKRGVGDAEWRQALSRESDDLFQRDALTADRAVLVSHWRAQGVDTQSGTPTDWITPRYGRVIELHCTCTPEAATERFTARQRHPGHLDEQRTPDRTLSWMNEYHSHLPLALGTLVRVDPLDAAARDRMFAKLEHLLSSAN